MCLEAAANQSPWVDAEDAILAARHHLPLLITAACNDTMVAMARRVHGQSFAGAAPLVMFHASGFFGQRVPFAAQWAGLMDAGRGGSILVTAVEEMSIAAQTLFAESLSTLRRTPPPRAPRLITGTTVSLLDRVTAGEFSEDLFYRLNVLHLVMHDSRDCWIG